MKLSLVQVKTYSVTYRELLIVVEERHAYGYFAARCIIKTRCQSCINNYNCVPVSLGTWEVGTYGYSVDRNMQAGRLDEYADTRRMRRWMPRVTHAKQGWRDGRLGFGMLQLESWRLEAGGWSTWKVKESRPRRGDMSDRQLLSDHQQENRRTQDR